jgi:ABC-type Fe3+/spermidine/putrescine transport system ATPase subunit
MTDPGSILALQGVTKRYGAVLALDQVDFAVQPGEIFTLLGPSGCGKSTTLRIVAGLEENDAGRVWIRERCVADPRQGIHVPAYRRNLGMVFQSYAIWPHMTVAENVAYPLTVRRENRTRIDEKVRQMLALVGLAGLERRPATQLSGGQQQRVALARALVYSSDLVLLDEPFSNLDAHLRQQMRTELRQVRDRLGSTVLFVTHDQEEALVLSDRIGVMRAGRFEQIDSPRTLYEQPATAFVRDFLGQSVVLRAQLVEQLLDGSGVVSVPGNGASQGTLRVRALAGARVGERITISFRPEYLRLRRASGEEGQGENGCLRAEVLQQTYVGRYSQLLFRAGEASFLAPLETRERFASGERVRLAVDPEQITVWTDEPSPGAEQSASAADEPSPGDHDC